MKGFLKPPGVGLQYDRGSILIWNLPGGDAEILKPVEGVVWDARVGAHRCHGLHYRAVVRALTQAGIALEDQAREYPELPAGPRRLPDLFEHQRLALEAWERGKRGVVELPTGAGKTMVALQAMAQVGRGSLVLVPTLDLAAQWCREIESVLGVPSGMIGGGEHEVLPVTVSTYASALRKGEHFGNRFCLAVFDECHHLAAEGNSQIAEMLIAPYRLGLSATVERPDDRHLLLDRLIGPLVFRRGIHELSGAVLSEYRVEVCHAALSEEEQRMYREARAEYLAFARANDVLPTSGRDWQRFIWAAARSEAGRQALKAFQTQRQISFAAEGKFVVLGELLERHRGERVLVFTNDNLTAYEISRRFLIPLITHQTKLAERKQIMERFRDNRWPFLVTSRVLNEGVDVPECGVAVILSGSASVREHVQRLGRILRRREGKQAVLYEVLTRFTGEEGVSQRRRQHDAYR